jgi:undecaprenyl-diphosphatase
MVVLFAQDGAAVVAVVAAVAMVLVGHRLAAYAAVAAALLVAHAVLSSFVVVVGHLGPVGPDLVVAVTLTGARSPVVTSVLTAVTTAGNTVGMTIFAIGVCGVLLWRRHTWAAGVMVSAVGGAGLLIVAVKNGINRPRPAEVLRLVTETTLSFPSGHSLSSIVALGMATAIATELLRRRGIATWIIVVASFATVFIGVSRVYLGVHWTTDVLDGWLLGGAWLAVCLAALSEVRRRDTEPCRLGRGEESSATTVTHDGGGPLVGAAHGVGGRRRRHSLRSDDRAITGR